MNSNLLGACALVIALVAVVDFSANLLVRSWRALEPFIRQERLYRQKSMLISPGFVTHFEHLATLALDADGKPGDNSIHKSLKLKKVLGS